MRRLLLATTAISALAFAPALGLAQVQSNGPSGAIQEQPRNQEHGTPKGGKSMTPAQGETAPGKSAQTQAPQKTEQPQRLQGEAQPEPQGKGKQQRLQGQAQPEPQGRTEQQRVQGQTQPNGPQHMQGQAQPRGTQQNRTGTAGVSGGAQGHVQVTQQQKTQIHERLAHTRVERIEHPQFSVRVGAEVPRSVHVEVLPPEIVEVVPEYEGYDYVMVGDEILIVDPDSLQIVAVIPA